MRQAYYSYLLDSNQEERAAELKVREHDFLQAIKLYMKGVRSLFLPSKVVFWYYNYGVEFICRRVCPERQRRLF